MPLPVATEPFFLEGRRGRLFAMSLSPVRRVGGPDADPLLYFPPFAEEMNKARRMAALQARAFAGAGRPVLLVDLFGTGDSQGDFAAATWEDWLADIDVALDWLVAHGAKRVIFWGVRLGALMAAEAAIRCAAASRLLLWSPVVRGDVFLAQFLRLRLAADLIGGSAKQSVEDMKAALRAGEALEVAGYELNPALTGAIESRSLHGFAQGNCQVDWFEVSAAPGAGIKPVVQRVVDAWRAAGSRVELRELCGEPFWSTPEVVVVPALVDATLEALPL